MVCIGSMDMLPASDTQGYTLLALTGICGELPADLLLRLPGGKRYKSITVSALKGQGLLRTYYRDHLRGYRLGRRAKTLLCTEQPERFSFFLTGGTDTSHLKSEVTRRLRLHKIAAAMVLMQNAGVRIFRDEKPDIFAPDGFDDAHRLHTFPAFYSSREVKAIGPDAIKIRGSRMAGVLLTHSGVFLTYAGGSDPPEWDHRAEQRAKALVSLIVCRERLPGRYAMNDVHGLLLCSGMEPLAEILAGAHTSKRCFFLLDGNYTHFYYLSNDHHGDILLRLLCDGERRAAFERRLLAALREPSRGLPVEHDALDAQGRPVLFACLPDIPRLARFLSGLALHGIEGCIVCFDFQAQALRGCCGENISLLAVSFENFEKEGLL